MVLQSLSSTLACPNCKGVDLNVALLDQVTCSNCSSQFHFNQYGFLEIGVDASLYSLDATTDEYAGVQVRLGARVYNEYLKPLLAQSPCQKVLEVGCGLGSIISAAGRDGYEAWGIDLPNLAKFWKAVDNDPERFLCCTALRLPFPDNSFDVVYSLGVIEHIGTEIGHCTLSENYIQDRQQYANEIMRITRPGGRIIIACPNKTFPLDIQHGPTDELSVETWSTQVRNSIYRKTGINIHPIWGKNHLLSYAETKKLFSNSGASEFKPLSLKGYFAFSSLGSGFLSTFAKLATGYVNNLPPFLRPTSLNPYMLVQIKK